MAEKRYLHDINLDTNRLLNARIHPVTTAQRSVLTSQYNTGDEGVLVFDIDLDVFFVWDGVQWVTIGSGGGGNTVRYLETFTATASQTVFTTTNTLSASLFDVYLNGVLLNTSSYTFTSSTITLNDGALAGDIIDVIIFSSVAVATQLPSQLGNAGKYLTTNGSILSWATVSGGVSSVSVTSANGFSGTVANASTTPAITLSTSIAGLLKGSSGALVAATPGTDYQAPIALTTNNASGAATFISNTLNIPTYTLVGLGGEPAITSGTTSQYWRGDKSWQTLNTTAVTEGTNLYFTNARSRSAISLTTTGSSGAATYDSATGVLNIPQYSSGAAGVSSITFSGTGLSPNTVSTGAIAVTGTLNAATGGTGWSSYTTGDLLYASGTTALSKLSGNTTSTKNVLISTGSGGLATAPVWGTLTNTDVGAAATTHTHTWAQITSTPTTITGYGITDAYTKTEVDSFVQGLDPKASVKVATTANITLSGTQTIDGIGVVAGDRVLVKDQTTASQNGIYVVAAGSWTRATDMDVAAEFPGAYVFTEQGTANADKGFVCTNDSVTVGTTNITFVQFSGSGAYQAILNGTGYVKMSGTTVSYVSSIPIADLASNTISGVALGGNLNSVTFNNGGAGVATGSTYNGSSAITVSYNTIGAQPLASNLTSLAALSFSATSFVKMTAAGTFGLDTNTYYLASNPSGYTNNTGTVTSVTVTTANGVSGTVLNQTSAAAITLTLGAITPTSVNGLTFSALATGFSIAGGTTSKTLTVSNTLTLAGTDTSTLNIGSGGTLGTAAFTASTAYQASSSNLTSLAALTFASTSFVKMTGANTFALDTNTYLTSANAVTSLTGTANQVTVSASTGAVTLSLPQSINTGATPTFAGLTLTGGTVTVSTPLESITQTWNAGAVSFNGILINITDTASAAASTFIRYQTGAIDRFVIRKDGAVTTGIWNGTSIALANGGTNASLTAVNGGIVYSTASALAISAAGTSGQILTSAGASAPTWTNQSALSVGTATTATNIASGVANQILYQSAAGTTAFITAPVTASTVLTWSGTAFAWTTPSGTGTVTSVSVATANGFAGSVTTPTAAASITLSTTVTGLLKGNGTAISAAVAGTDYLAPFASQTANTFYAAPNGSAGTPSFRAVVGADVPIFTSLLQGTVPASGGGTTNFLRADGTWAAPSGGGGGVTSISFDTTGLTPSTATTGAVTVAGTLAIANGGTGQTTANAAYNALSPMTTLGDITYEASGAIATRLPGNTTTTKQFLTQTGTGTASAAPAWGTILGADVPLFTSTLQGTVPSSGGGTTNFLRADGTWAVPAGGSATPSGSTGNIQFNNAGAFGSNALFVFNNTAVSMGIGVTTINNAAMLELNSSTKGFMVPRMTAAQKTAIASPPIGLLIYQTDSPQGFYVWATASKGTKWYSITMA